jgi:hypothetical protein
MDTRYGMSERFGLMGLETVESQYLEGRTSMNCADQTAAAVDDEVMGILKQCYGEALAMLRENREVMDKIAAYLIEQETITGKEFMKIYREAKGLPEPSSEADNSSVADNSPVSNGAEKNSPIKDNSPVLPVYLLKDNVEPVGGNVDVSVGDSHVSDNSPVSNGAADSSDSTIEDNSTDNSSSSDNSPASNGAADAGDSEHSQFGSAWEHSIGDSSV